jgi:hypothetical protein
MVAIRGVSCGRTLSSRRNGDPTYIVAMNSLRNRATLRAIAGRRAASSARRARRWTAVGFEERVVDEVADQVLAMATCIHRQCPVDRADALGTSALAVQPDDDLVALFAVMRGEPQRIGPACRTLRRGGQGPASWRLAGWLLHLVSCVANRRPARQPRWVAVHSFRPNINKNSALRSSALFYGEIEV